MFYLYPVEKEFSNFYKNKKIAKRVSFQNIIKVVFIPKYKDICDCKDIWWTEIDKRNAMIFMNNEITTLQKIHPNMTFKQATKLLYQPNNIRYYDPTNFV
jgi:hypothetical protein